MFLVPTEHSHIIFKIKLLSLKTVQVKTREEDGIKSLTIPLSPPRDVKRPSLPPQVEIPPQQQKQQDARLDAEAQLAPRAFSGVLGPAPSQGMHLVLKVPGLSFTLRARAKGFLISAFRLVKRQVVVLGRS